MTELEFWHLISVIDVAALDEGLEDQAVEPLRSALNAMAEPELFAFEEILSQKLHALDGKVFAEQAGSG